MIYCAFCIQFVARFIRPCLTIRVSSVSLCCGSLSFCVHSRSIGKNSDGHYHTVKPVFHSSVKAKLFHSFRRVRPCQYMGLKAAPAPSVLTMPYLFLTDCGDSCCKSEEIWVLSWLYFCPEGLPYVFLGRFSHGIFAAASVRLSQEEGRGGARGRGLAAGEEALIQFAARRANRSLGGADGWWLFQVGEG